MTDPVSAPQGGGRGVLESAFALLGALEQAGAAGVTRLAAECGLPKTTAHRLLEQLSSLGVVERSRGGYSIGARVFQLGHSWQPYRALRTAVREPMRRLAIATGVTVTVNVLRDGADMIVDCVPGRDGPPVPLDSGGTWPWMTASGKALVAGVRVEHGGFGSGVGGKIGGEIGGRFGGDSASRGTDQIPATWRREAATIRDRGSPCRRGRHVGRRRRPTSRRGSRRCGAGCRGDGPRPCGARRLSAPGRRRGCASASLRIKLGKVTN
jgi:IclR family transcriptional regulator, acetate operon repressor